MFFGHKNIRNIKAAHSMGDINFCSSVLLSKNKKNKYYVKKLEYN